MTSVLVPWNTCGVYVSSVLGVATLDYLPYCFMNWLNPLVALAMTWAGVAILWQKDASENESAASAPSLTGQVVGTSL